MHPKLRKERLKLYIWSLFRFHVSVKCVLVSHSLLSNGGSAASENLYLLSFASNDYKPGLHFPQARNEASKRSFFPMYPLLSFFPIGKYITPGVYYFQLDLEAQVV